MAAPDGIRIVLTRDRGRIVHARIASPRTALADRLFAGKSPDDILPKVPLLFSLCGTAQAVAAVQATEQAADRPAAAAQTAARHLLVLAELVAEHGLALVRDWPLLAGAKPQMDAAKAMRATLRPLRMALYPDGDWLTIGGGRLVPDRQALTELIAALRGAIDAGLDQPVAALTNPAGFEHWLSGPGADTLPGLVVRRGWQDLGRGSFAPLPVDGPDDLADRLAGDEDGQYQRRPDWRGRTWETGPLAQHHHHPVLTMLCQRHGTGLLPRLAARLIAVATALAEAEATVAALGADPGRGAAPLGDGSGSGRIQTARGLLAHRVDLTAGMIGRYRILAPTEWNFHPAGPLATALTGLVADDTLDLRARLLIHAFDPCVACTVDMGEADA